jgi:hypothetical protein
VQKFLRQFIDLLLDVLELIVKVGKFLVRELEGEGRPPLDVEVDQHVRRSEVPLVGVVGFDIESPRGVVEDVVGDHSALEAVDEVVPLCVPDSLEALGYFLGDAGLLNVLLDLVGVKRETRRLLQDVLEFTALIL